MKVKINLHAILITLIALGCSKKSEQDVEEIKPWDYKPLYRSTEDAAPRWTEDGRILFYSYRFNHSAEIMSMSADGSRLERITNDETDQWWPDMSPTDQSIVFTSDQDITKKFNGGNLYLLNLETKEKKQLTHTGEGIWNTNPIFSPDGHWIVYNHDWRGRDGDAEIFKINPDGTENINLTDNAYNDSYPSWSPNGDRIAYVTTVEETAQLMLMKSDGTGKELAYSFEKGSIYSTSWVADDELIITLEYPDIPAQVVSVNLGTKELKTLTTNAHGDYFADYSSIHQKIVFTSRRNGQNDVFTIDADGSNPTNLTLLASYNQKPSASEDGKIVLFVSRRDGNQDIFQMTEDASDIQNITSSKAIENYPKISPDESSVLFSKLNKEQNNEIWIKELKTGDSYSLIADNFDNDEPCWSTGANKIAFRSNRDGNDEIYEYNLETSELTRLTNTPNVSESNPSYSPDKESIAFISSGAKTGIVVLNRNSLETNYLTPEESTDVFPAWSPKGDKIVFSSRVENGFDLYIMNKDGSERKQITDLKEYNNFYPVWAANDVIYFESNMDTRYQIFSINIEGDKLRRISHLGQMNRKL